MSALVIIMSIGTKPHFKREAVRDTAGIGTIGSDRGQGPPSAFGTGPPRAYSGTAQVWHAFSSDLTVLPCTCTPRSSANEMNCFFLPSRSWSSFTDPGRMEGSSGLGS